MQHTLEWCDLMKCYQSFNFVRFVHRFVINSNDICLLILCIQLTDILFAELPRVRLDRVRRPSTKHLFDPHPTLCEVPEENESYLDSPHSDDFNEHLEQQQHLHHQLELNTTLGSPLGMYLRLLPFHSDSQQAVQLIKLKGTRRAHLFLNQFETKDAFVFGQE